MAAPRLRLRRGSTAPTGSIALSGEPFVDTTGGNFYIASGESTFIHIGGGSYVSRVDESLTSATATTSGSVTILSRTDGSGGGSIIFDVADTANNSTYTWPDAPTADRVLQSDANGNLSWVTQTSGYVGWTISDGTNTSLLSSGETLTASGGSGVSVSVTGNGDAISITGTGTVADISGLTPTDGGFIVGDGNNFIVESAATARASLGVDAAGTDNSTDVTLVTTTADYLSITGQAITLGQIDLTTDVTGALPLANGGTNATTAADARTNLGLAIGTDVQAHGAILDDLSGLTQAADKLPYFDSATTAATTDLSAFGRSLIDDADAAAARSTLGVDAAGTDNSTNVTLVTTTADYLSITGQAITLGLIDLTTDVTGALPNANLANSTVSYGGVQLSLGGSDATPAFDLTDATNYPASSLTGTVANNQLANSTITVTDGITSTATALGGTITFSGTANEVTVGESAGTITVGLPNDVTVGNNLTVTGNLTVNGTTTTLSTTNTTVSDRLIELANGTTGTPTADSGLVIERGDSANVFIGFDEGSDIFVVGTTTGTGTTTDLAPTPIAFLALQYNVTDTAGTNEAVIAYNGTSSQRELQNVVVDAGTY